MQFSMVPSHRMRRWHRICPKVLVVAVPCDPWLHLFPTPNLGPKCMIRNDLHVSKYDVLTGWVLLIYIKINLYSKVQVKEFTFSCSNGMKMNQIMMKYKTDMDTSHARTARLRTKVMDESVWWTWSPEDESLVQPNWLIKLIRLQFQIFRICKMACHRWK